MCWRCHSLSVDTGDLTVIEELAKTGFITDATTNPPHATSRFGSANSLAVLCTADPDLVARTDCSYPRRDSAATRATWPSWTRQWTTPKPSSRGAAPPSAHDTLAP
eukprot:681605-Rhodomonas_salina.1